MPASKLAHSPVALVAALIGCALLGSAPAQAATQAELEARVEVLSAQLEAMQAEIASGSLRRLKGDIDGSFTFRSRR